jgi:hypothetical protein
MLHDFDDRLVTTIGQAFIAEKHADLILGQSRLTVGYARSEDGCQSALAQKFREPTTDSVV